MALKAISRTLLGTVALVLVIPIGACASSSSANSSLTACHVTANELTIPGGGKSSAPVLPAESLNVDGSTALAPLFQQAAGNVLANSANSKVTVNITPNGSGVGLND